MDADAYLRRHGWKGTGHSLDHHGRGIKKPLLIAHKQDQLGLGKKKAAHNVDDQWWMRAFDESLKNIGTGQESTLSQIRTKGINRGGLYGFFVKGEGLIGTVSNTEESSAAEASNSSTPPSGTTTPPTSISESDSTADSSDGSGTDSDDYTMGKKKRIKVANNKRKRELREAKEKGLPPPMKKQKKEEPLTEPPSEVNTYLGTFNLEQMTKVNATVRWINRQIKTVLESNAKKGVYGVYIPAKELEGRKKGSATPHFQDPNNPGKTVTYKQAKFARAKAMREAKREMTMERVTDAVVKGDLPNPEHYTKDEALKNFTRIERALESLAKAEKKITGFEKKVAKHAERKEKLEQARAEEAQRLAEKRAKAQAKIDKKNTAIAAKIAKLSPTEQAQYARRAAAKGQTMEEYVHRRIQKKNRARAAKEAADEAKQKMGLAPDVLFFEDTEGDTKIIKDAEAAALGVQPIDYTPLEDGTCPLDPTIWEGRVVKTLPRAVREARRLWLAEKRREKKIASGKLKPGKQPHLTRVEKKMKKISRLTREYLSQEGIKEGATKEQRQLARRKAKHDYKVEKREREGRGGTAKIAQNMKGRHRVSERAKARNKAAAVGTGGNAVAVAA